MLEQAVIDRDKKSKVKRNKKVIIFPIQ